MYILAIDTSCDETSAAITHQRRVISNVIYSQVLLHKQWGGVVPSIAKRAHEERIDWVISESLKKARLSMKDIDYIAVTQGPGLAIALEVGIRKAKELALKYNKKLIAVNHMAGHIYSCFVQNSKGKPIRDFEFPYLAVLVSGKHTELVLFKSPLEYEVVGKTVDDALGEVLDKAAKMLGLGYPGGQTVERLAQKIKNIDQYKFVRPMIRSNNLNMSFSGLKTAFYYHTKNMNDQEKVSNISQLLSSFQEAAFDSLLYKIDKALKQIKVNNLVVGGGVAANLYLRRRLKLLAKKYNKTVLFPSYKYLTGDNAAMIGVAAYYQVVKDDFVKDLNTLERVPRLSL